MTFKTGDMVRNKRTGQVLKTEADYDYPAEYYELATENRSAALTDAFTAHGAMLRAQSALSRATADLQKALLLINPGDISEYARKTS